VGCGLNGLACPAHLLTDHFVHGDGAVGEGYGAEDDGEGVVAWSQGVSGGVLEKGREGLRSCGVFVGEWSTELFHCGRDIGAGWGGCGGMSSSGSGGGAESREDVLRRVGEEIKAWLIPPSQTF
jgi:hypothetical protein